MLIVFLLFFFFFKQKTAYEMRISDWSSDVCSSDLPTLARTCENLKTPNHAGASIITCHHHSISILQPDRASENRRHASLPQGGRETPVTVRRCSMPFCSQTRPKIWPIHPSVPPWSRCTNCTPLSVRMVWIL